MATLDGLILNGLNLCDEVNWVLEAIDFTPPKKRAEFTPGADSDGALLVRTPLYENRTVTMTLRVAPQATMDLALEKIGTLVDLLQEAEQNPGGIPLEWSPAGATKKVTLYVLTGEVTGIPMVMEGSSAGWYVGRPAPQLTVSLTCRPFGYGEEVTAAAAKANETGLSIVTLTIPSVAGDVPAEGRLIVKDTAAVGRRFVEWGLQQRYYDATTALIVDNESLTPVGGAQSTALNASGAYKPGGATKGTLATTLIIVPTICCNTGVLKHVGTFRVKARVQTISSTFPSLPSNAHVRLAWQDGEGPLRANEWVSPSQELTFVELDLGTITVSPAITGSQKWLGQIEAYSLNQVTTDTLHIDYLTLIPVGEGYGKARGVQATSGMAAVAYDNFTTGVLSGALNARVPAIGAAWATSGSATDFTVASEAASRSTTSDAGPRFGIFGASVAGCDVSMEATASGGKGKVGLIARWVDANNYLRAEISEATRQMFLIITVAGVETTLALSGVPFPTKALGAVTLTLIVLADGSVKVERTEAGEKEVKTQNHAALASGGALAAGKAGIYDFNSTVTAATRKYRALGCSTFGVVPYCIQPSRTMEVHSDSTLTFDSTGVYAGPPPQYRGSRFYVPQDGSANRVSRILVKADRNDLQEANQQTIADAFTVEAKVTPRYVAIPR